MQAKTPPVWIAALLLCAAQLSLCAQVPMNLPKDRAGIEARQASATKNYADMRKVQSTKDLGAGIDAIPAFIRQHAAFSAEMGVVFNFAYSFQGWIKKDHPDPKVVSQKLQAIEDALQQSVPAYYHADFDYEIASLFVKNDHDTAIAEKEAQSAVALYNQSDCLEDDRYVAENRHIYDEKSAKHPVPFTYHIEDGNTHCAAQHAARYSLLGKIEAKLGNTEVAEDNFQKALALHPDMTAALGMVTIEEAKGDKAAALEMMTVGYLTGAMEPEDIVKAKALYAELHPGSGPEDFNEMVGQRYAKTFVNPVKDAGPAPQPAHPQHVVLEELFTGAGCEPCMAPDLATDAALHRYTRDQLVVAIYHNNAPDSDPLTNDTGEARAKYYATQGSTPHVFVDGKEREIEEGLPSHAQSSFGQLTKIVDPLLAERSDATLSVKAERHGNTVDVDLTGSAKTLPAKTHLEILLVETEVGYSGRNTLHFQPMVVRASAGLKDHDTGLAIAAAAAIPQHYSFDLKKIEAANFAYYDEFRLDLEKRMARFMTSGGMTKAEIDKMAAFPEPKNLIHPDRLAVIAFLQADDSKKVLQATYVPVSDTQGGEQR